MIPLAECKHGWTYRIRSRNLSFGVFNKETEGFVGIRSKFDDLYLFTEFHWETGAPHGMVSPLEAIEECPVKDLREDFGPRCVDCEGAVHFIRNDRHGSGTGDWMHVVEPEGCPNKGPLNGSDRWGSTQNGPLFDYLKKVGRVLRANS
jgi:hypothetical protein